MLDPSKSLTRPSATLSRRERGASPSNLKLDESLRHHYSVRRVEARDWRLQVREGRQEPFAISIHSIRQRIVRRNIRVIRSRESRKQHGRKRRPTFPRARENIPRVIEQPAAVRET